MSHQNDSVYDPTRQCYGKRGYSSRSKARRAGKRMKHVRGVVFDYRCPHCGLIHLGRRP